MVTIFFDAIVVHEQVKRGKRTAKSLKAKKGVDWSA